MTPRVVQGTPDDPGRPQRAVVVAPDSLNRAVEALAAVPGATSLNVRAGEPIAGILLTAFNGPPRHVDTRGEIDFVFRRHPTDWPWTFGQGDLAAVEVKSSPGAYRHAEANMAVGDTFHVPVRATADLLNDTSQLVDKAVAALNHKAPPGASRHVFLLMHPFDGVPPEPFETHGLLASHLPPVDNDVDLDSLWVLFHSLSALAVWSSADQQWTNYLVAGWNPEDGPEPDVLISDLDDAENRFLTLTGHTKGSPWQFGIQSTADDT